MTPPSPSLTPEERQTYQNFFVYWLGQIASLLGSAVVQFVLTWWITEETQNPTYLSLGLFFTFLPRIIFGPLAGVLADKVNKKVLIAVSDALQALTTLVLIIILWSFPLNIWLVLGFNAFRAIFQSFHSPASSTITPLMVPRSKLSKINSLGQLFSALIEIVSPLLGATLMQWFDVRKILWVDIITFLIAFGLLLQLRLPKLKSSPESQTQHTLENLETFQPDKDLESREKIENPQKPRKSSVWLQFREGISVLRQFPGMMALIMVLTLTNLLLSPFNVLITYFVNFTHGGNEWSFVLLSVAINLGMIIGSIIPSLKSDWKHKTFLIFLSLFFVFVGIFFFSLAPPGDFLWMSIFSFMITFLLPIAMTINITMLQSVIPLDKFGRVIAFFSALNSIAMLIGYIAAGPIAGWIGIVPLYLISSSLGIVMIILTYFFTAVRKLDSLEISPDPIPRENAERIDPMQTLEMERGSGSQEVELAK